MKSEPFHLDRRDFLGAATAAGTWAAIGGRPAAAEEPRPGSGRAADGPTAGQVVPIQWESFRNTPADDDSLRARAVLRNAARYGFTTWWDTRMKYPTQKGQHLDFGKDLRKLIREPVGMASVMATALTLGAYDADLTGVPEAEARSRALRLIRSVAYRHRANSDGPVVWGRAINSAKNDKYNSSQFVVFAGVAAWLMWPHLDVTVREYVRKMMEDEADFYLGLSVLYHRDKAGKVRYAGDTKAEELSWRVTLFQLATAMMPGHRDYAKWMNKGIENALASMARPSDVNGAKVYHGRPLSEWLNGSNLNENATVVNHGIDPHPHYTISMILSNYCGAVWYTLVGRPTPEAFHFNADKVYRAMVELKFSPADGYQAPGGTMYVPGSAELYSPSGNDKGSNEYIKYGLGDANVRHFGGDELLPEGRKAADWERLHVQKALDMQSRSKDGSSNRTDAEGGAEREWWIGYHAARLYLIKWVAAQNRFATTNEAFR